jgi:hypothetical protein
MITVSSFAKAARKGAGRMNAESVKTELLMSHFRHALDQLSGHYAELGDIDALADVRRVVEAAVDDARVRSNYIAKIY